MLELKNISTGYGKEAVIKEASTTFEKGKVTGIIGVNGCGKSTLLKAIVGTLPIFDGEITLDEREAYTMSRKEIAQRIAYLSQEKNTPDMTAFQMVLHGRFPYLSYPHRYTENDRRIAENSLRAVGISRFAQTPLSDLSGGIRQMVYIAMALAQDTDYILFDEPTTYLDITHQLELFKILKGLADSGKGIVAVMHDLLFAFEFCDEIAVIHNGTVITKSKPCELCNSSIIQEIFNVQIKELNGKYFYDV